MLALQARCSGSAGGRSRLSLVIGKISCTGESSLELEGPAGLSQAAERAGQVDGTVRKHWLEETRKDSPPQVSEGAWPC